MDNAQPVLFLAHGDPMNALRDNAFTRALVALGKGLRRPDAVVVYSAHWLTRGVRVGAAALPATIHDFGGFPEELYRERYPAPGDPRLAQEIAGMLPGAVLDAGRGLDHGVWSVLKFLFPGADVPVVPISMDVNSTVGGLLEQGRALRSLRERNVLLVGSGNIVHNVGMYFTGKGDEPFPWATEFDAFVERALLEGDIEGLAGFERTGALARQAHPTIDHLLPLFPCLGAVARGESMAFPYREVVRSLSMRCVRWG